MIQKSALLVIIQFYLTGSSMAQNNHLNRESDILLQYVIRKSNVKTTQSPMLILLHGHGSNEYDMFSLSTKVPRDWIVVSVRGPYKLAENSYRWYDAKMANGKIAINIDEEERSRKKLLKLITYLSGKYQADRNKIVAAGFSQGANMAQSLGLGDPNLITGFGVFSGRYIGEFTPFISNSIALKSSKAFISHGSGDNMLPTTYSEENIRKLKDLGIQITYCEDSNGHSISTNQWNEFSKWLMNIK